MARTVAVFGSSFNPPGVHHREIAARLADHYSDVVVIPCGPRPDKAMTNDVPPIYRATMADMTFGQLDRVRVELSDLEASVFTRTHRLDERYRAAGEVWHVVRAELLDGGGRGASDIHRTWERGPEIWRRCRFAVVKPRDVPLDPADLPPKHHVFEVDRAATSREIRARVFHHDPIDGLVVPRVDRYIERHRLYRGMLPSRTTRLVLDTIRPLVIADPYSANAQRVAAELRKPEHEKQPNLIAVVGGDGTMLRAIRSHWRLRLPFFGINVGHMGFLLNGQPPSGRELVLHQLPLLSVTTEGPDGDVHTSLAFNDAWVERSSGQTAWVSVTVDGRERLKRLVADGVLVATAAGSTSYARAMGAQPLPANTPALMLVGSNVLRPAFWRPAVLSLESTVELTTLDADKRPLRGFVDGVPQGEVHHMRARVANTAAAELAFEPEHDPAEKLAQIQFPL